MKNKCTLLIDGNWLLLSRFSVVGQGFNIDLDEHVKECSKHELQDLMAKSISIVLNRFNIIDNVILVTDGGSWRKQLPIPKVIENVTYKGNRSTAKEHDWKYIYSALSDLSEHCKEQGIVVSNHSSIEGDDWIWYWSRRLNEEGTSCIIWSSDNDLKQLVQVDNSTMAFTAWYNDKNGLFLHTNMCENYVDDLDFFMSPIKVKSPILEDIIKSSKSVNYINPDEIVMEKIICGDAGDNIKSIAKIVSGSKTYKVSAKMWNEIKNKFSITTLDEFFKLKQDIINSILSLKKFNNCIYNDLSDMFDYNIKLVWLNETIIPETIIMYMNQLEYNIADTSYIRSNFKTLCKKDTEIEAIFDSLPF